MRLVTFNFDTATVIVSGVFTFSHYNVAVGSTQVNVVTSPAVLEFPPSAPSGMCTAVVQAVDTDGIARGAPLNIDFMLPSETTAINAPISGNATVVLS